MQQPIRIRLAETRIAQLRDLVGTRKGDPMDSGSAADVLGSMIQREWEQQLSARPPADFRIKAGPATDAPPCVLIGHDRLGVLLMTSQNAMALGRGARRVANGQQDACLLVESCFPRNPVLVHLRPHGCDLGLSFGKRDPLGLTRTTTLELSNWLIAAAGRAEAMS